MKVVVAVRCYDCGRVFHFDPETTTVIDIPPEDVKPGDPVIPTYALGFGFTGRYHSQLCPECAR